RSALVIAEVALSVILLITAGLLVRSLRASQQLDPGIEADELLTASLNINLLKYTRAQGRAFYSNAVERVQSIPGVKSATVARVGVLTGSARTLSISVEGKMPASNTYSSEGDAGTVAPGSSNANIVGPQFFSTLGIALPRGRDFNAQDTED